MSRGSDSHQPPRFERAPCPVTGASSGFGAHFARLLANQGATVILAARRLDRLQKLQREIEQKGGNAFAVEMDVTEADSVDKAFQTVAENFGAPCTILVNNSGIGQSSWLLETTESEWQSILDTNLSGVWRVAQRAAQAMVTAGVSGSIVNVASITALRTAYMVSGYAASKAAVEHLTRLMALELSKYAIRVNALAPGYFATELSGDYLNSEAGDKLRKRVPLKRFGTFEELDLPLLNLASDAGAYMTGATLVIDGGHSISPL